MAAKVPHINCIHYRFGVGTCTHPCARRTILPDRDCVLLGGDQRVTACAVQEPYGEAPYARWLTRTDAGRYGPPRPWPDAPPMPEVQPPKGLTMDEQQMARCFNEWMDRYTKDPDGFMREFQSVTKHLAERATGQEPSYGAQCAAYMMKLRGEVTAG